MKSAITRVCFGIIAKAKSIEVPLRDSRPLRWRLYWCIIFSQKVYGRITNYRIGPKSQASKVCLIEFEGVDSAGSAGKLIGQKVKWRNQTTSLLGRVTGLHGRNGMVKVTFKHGVPGQSIGTAVEIIS